MAERTSGSHANTIIVVAPKLGTVIRSSIEVKTNGTRVSTKQVTDRVTKATTR